MPKTAEQEYDFKTYQVTYVVIVEATDDDDAEQLAKELIANRTFEPLSVEVVV